MKYKIEKELIAKIYKDLHPTVKEILKVEIKGKTKNVYVITYTDFDDLNEGYISASQSFYAEAFFFICKAWALKQKYKIITETRDYGTEYVIIDKKDSIFEEYKKIYSYYSESEIQAVFDACQWILDNKK